MTCTENGDRTRNRLIATFFAGNAITSIAYIGVLAISSLIAKDITGSTGLSGIPGMMAMLGVGTGATVLSASSVRIGRRPTFSAGYALAAGGAILAGVSVATGTFTLLLVGMFAIGFGRSTGTLARFAAGDLREESRRAGAIGLILWASAIGAVIGPLLIGPAGALAEAAGRNQLLGPILVGALGFGLGSILMFGGLRPEPLTLAMIGSSASSEGRRPRIAAMLKVPTVRLSLAALSASQFTMALLLVITPLHIQTNGGNLATVGFVMTALPLGMYGVAPISGRLVDRFGSEMFVGLGLVTLMVASILAGASSASNLLTLTGSLFLLGVGWNFVFVGGSTLLQSGLILADRVAIQGYSISASLAAGAVAAALSGIVVAATSYATLATFGALVAVVPIIGLYRFETTRSRDERQEHS